MMSLTKQKADRHTYPAYFIVNVGYSETNAWITTGDVAVKYLSYVT